MESRERPAVWVPEDGAFGPITLPASLGAVALAGGITTTNPIALWFGVALVALGIVGGGVLALARAASRWPRELDSPAAGRRLLAEHRPEREDYRRAFLAIGRGGLLFGGALVPLWYLGVAARRESLGLGLPDQFVWIVALMLFSGTVLALFVGARTIGRGIDRLGVELAREIAYRRQVEG